MLDNDKVMEVTNVSQEILSKIDIVVNEVFKKYRYEGNFDFDIYYAVLMALLVQHVLGDVDRDKIREYLQNFFEELVMNINLNLNNKKRIMQ